MIQVLVVDDEALARERLIRFIEAVDGYSLVGEAKNGHEALEAIYRLEPDVILLDIRMPGMDGLEVAQHLTLMDEPPAVIFTTAYDDYAIEAFKVHAVDYLLKPVRQEVLLEALQKTIKPKKPLWRMLNQENGKPKARSHVSSKTRQGIVLVPIEDIYYFKAEHKYVTVRHAGGEVIIEDTIKELEAEFEEDFIRIHRNSLVGKRHIFALEKNESGQPCLALKGMDERLDVSRRHSAKLRQFMR